MEYSNNDTPQRSYPPTSPRMQFSVNESIDDRRAERNHYDYDNRLKPEYEEHHDQRIKSDYEEHQPASQPRRVAVHNAERVRIVIVIDFNWEFIEVVSNKI